MSRDRADDFLRLIRGETRGPAAALARLGLRGAGGLYGGLVRARNLAYDRGWQPAHRASVPVISVGNLTLGGTGKTPMVEWLARWYRRRGVRVCLISRGYGHSGGVNDEGLVLEENLPDVPHLQDPDRLKLAETAVAELETELIVLDDGFQHRRLARDLDVVMLDALDPFGLGRLFPGGLLREPVSGLRRASIVVASRADLVASERLDAIRARVRRVRSDLPVVLSRHAPLDLIDAEGESTPLVELSGRSIAGFSGIGNPEGFRQTVASLGSTLIDLKVYPDHHRYTAHDVSELAEWVTTARAELVLTTQKDLVKLRTATLGSIPLRALRVGLEIMDGLEALEQRLTPLLPAATAGC